MIVQSIGSGPDLALVHGWGLGRHAWEPVLEALAQRCRVHLIDLPGYGTTPASSADFAQTAQALVDELPAGVTLCGWSLGGMLALQAALLAPQKIARLILVGSTPSFMQRDGWLTAQPPALLDTFADAVASDAKTTLQRFIALLNQGDAQARPITRALTGQMLAGALPGTETLTRGLGWLRDVDLRAQIATIATPTLLSHGERDPLMPLAAAQWLKDALPNARLETFAASAHAPFLADPARFTALAGDFCHEMLP
jgi:pimeloyl-[acyl-carrier protein] methyl ester esterase